MVQVRTLTLILVMIFLVMAVSCLGNRGINRGPGSGQGDGAQDLNGRGSNGGGSGGDPLDDGKDASLTDLALGEEIWGRSGCTGCHVIGDDPGGNKGPNLTGVGDRLTVVQLKAYITNPSGVNPESKMPAQNVTPEDLEYLAKYLSVLSSDTVK